VDHLDAASRALDGLRRAIAPVDLVGEPGRLIDARGSVAVNVKVSLFSLSVSPTTGTLTVLIVCPGAKVTVPEVGE